MMNQNQQQVQIKVDDAIAKGNYANTMLVTHAPEEFVLDFLSVIHGQGVVTDRVILSPGHLKRMITALQDNLNKYEEVFGKVEPADVPETKLGFATE